MTIPSWLIIILALAAAVCMVVSYVKREDPKFKPLAVVAVVILIFCACVYIDNETGYPFNGGNTLESRLSTESAKRFNEAKIKKVAEYIKSKNPGKIVIIPQGGSEWAKNEYAKEQAELVKKYIGDAEIKPIEYTRDMNDPNVAAEPGPTVEEFNKFLKANQDAKLFIILESLPGIGDVTRLYALDIFNIAKNAGKQKVALFESFGDGNEDQFIKPLFKADIILVAVKGKAGLKPEEYEKPAPKDLNEAFDARYELVTKESLK